MVLNVFNIMEKFPGLQKYYKCKANKTQTKGNFLKLNNFNILLNMF